MVANWKMNPVSLGEARALFSKVKRAAARLGRTEVVVCPPFVFLNALLAGRVKLGAQDAFFENFGRYTGEVSPRMLVSSGVSFVIIGHSERRALGESDDIVSKKAAAALRDGLKVILCVGERERDGEGGHFEFLKNQIKQSLFAVRGRFLGHLVIAYEPLFAIGKSASDALKPALIRETVIFIRKTLSDIYGQEAARGVSVLYGGSVEPDNARAIFLDGGVSGALVGHKSLEAQDFVKMLKSIDAV